MNPGIVRPGPTYGVAGNVLLLLGSVGLALVLAELVLRALGISHTVFYQVDPLTGWAHIPGAQGWFTQEGQSYVRINTRGWRGKEWAVKKPAGVIRVAILGDSYTEAFQVPEDSAFPALLERNLTSALPGRYEVLNFGVSAFGTGQELLVLRHHVLEYSPDAVILAVTTNNDVSDNSRALKKIDYAPYFTLVDRRIVVDTGFLRSAAYLAGSGWRGRVLTFLEVHSRLAQLLKRARQLARVAASRRRRLAGPDPLAQAPDAYFEYRNPPPDSAWAQAWNVAEALVALINSECRSRNIPFYLVTLSNPEQVAPDASRQRAFAARIGVPDLFQPERRFEQMGQREGFDVLALAPLLASEAIATHEYYHGFGEYLGKGHWNARGHRAAAALLSPWLADRLRRDLGPR